MKLSFYYNLFLTIQLAITFLFYYVVNSYANMHFTYLQQIIYISYVTRFAKAIPNGTRIEIHFYCWLSNLAKLLHYLEIPSTYVAIAGQVCFPRWLIAVAVKPPRCTTGSVGPVNGINKDVSGARLLPKTVSTYPVDWVCFCHLLKTQHCCLCPNGRYNQPPAIHHLHHPPYPLPPAHSL